MKTVKELIQSYPTTERYGVMIPCNNFTDMVPLRSIDVRELLAIYILYEYKEKKVFLPQTVFAYCSLPLSLNQEYEDIMLTFLHKMTYDKHYFKNEKTYQHYRREQNEVFSDLLEGGNENVTKEMSLLMWTQYRVLFRDEAFSTKAVVEANPCICKTYNITYAGPLLF